MFEEGQAWLRVVLCVKGTATYDKVKTPQLTNFVWLLQQLSTDYFYAHTYGWAYQLRITPNTWTEYLYGVSAPNT